MKADFSTLGLSPETAIYLNKKGYHKPTPVQEKTIPLVIDGMDLIVKAKTGSGKTLAFLLPLIEGLDQDKTGTKVLILTPTRELALQITSVAEDLQDHYDFSVLSAYGGQDIDRQLRKLKKGIDIIIATPGRLLDHLGRGTIDLQDLQSFVLDEADQMLHIGFKMEVERIIKSFPGKVQFLCYSATFDSKVKKLAYRHMTSPKEVILETTENKPINIPERFIACSDRWKQEALFTDLTERNPFLGIIFCRTKRRADKLEFEMTQAGFNCNKLHGGMTQKARELVMKGFRDLKYQYLIATDVAARGLDISGLTHIYNYDLPESVEVYVHRIGRTGRMGKDGMAITFLTPKDEAFLSDLAKVTKKSYKVHHHQHKK